MSTSETRVEWRVESETLEDEFGTDEGAARRWLAITKQREDWEHSVLMRREVTITTSDWTEVPR
jgi:hypothetical protein